MAAAMSPPILSDAFRTGSLARCAWRAVVVAWVHRHSRRVQYDGLLSGLGIRQQQQAAAYIVMRPFDVEDFAQPGAREQQKAQCSGGKLVDRRPPDPRRQVQGKYRWLSGARYPYFGRNIRTGLSGWLGLLRPRAEMIKLLCWRQAMNTPAMLWTGRVLSGLFALFMLGASIAPKLLGLPVAEETMAQLGWPPGYALLIGVIELVCVVLYLIPRTSVLGAVLMMGLLGGAMATQIRVDNPLFSHILFSLYLGLFMWGGLWLRSQRVRALFPIQQEA
jgi:hypothetical protein